MNIQNMLIDLNSAGVTDQAIGEYLGASQSLVNRLRNGKHKSTSFERGVKIMALAKQTLPDKYKEHSQPPPALALTSNDG